MKLLLLLTTSLLCGCVTDAKKACPAEVQKRTGPEGKIDCVYHPTAGTIADVICEHVPTGRKFICETHSGHPTVVEQ